MGSSTSRPSALAPTFQRLETWDHKHAKRLLADYKEKDLDFGLDVQGLAELVHGDKDWAEAIIDAFGGTNGIVNALAFICGACLVSAGPALEKAGLVFDALDFDATEQISMDEMVAMPARGYCVMSGTGRVPSDEELEGVTLQAYRDLSKHSGQSITKNEFTKWLLRYLAGAPTAVPHTEASLLDMATQFGLTPPPAAKSMTEEVLSELASAGEVASMPDADAAEETATATNQDHDDPSTQQEDAPVDASEVDDHAHYESVEAHHDFAETHDDTSMGHTGYDDQAIDDTTVAPEDGHTPGEEPAVELTSYHGEAEADPYAGEVYQSETPRDQPPLTQDDPGSEAPLVEADGTAAFDLDDTVGTHTHDAILGTSLQADVADLSVEVPPATDNDIEVHHDEFPDPPASDEAVAAAAAATATDSASPIDLNAYDTYEYTQKKYDAGTGLPPPDPFEEDVSLTAAISNDTPDSGDGAENPEA